MANKHISHVKSNQTVTSNNVTTPKLPVASDLLYGEIAVNYAKGYERISLKNSNDEIVEFTSKAYTDTGLATKANTSDVYTKTEVNQIVYGSETKPAQSPSVITSDNLGSTLADGNDAVLTEGSNIDITYNSTTKKVTIAATDTTYSAFTGADGTNAGTSGLVPAPTATDNVKFLKGDGSWATVSTDNTAQLGITDATNKKVANSESTSKYLTFTNGTNKFTVTDADNHSFDVDVTPSITNNVTGSGLTTDKIVVGSNNDSTIKTSSKGIETTLTTNSDDNVPTSKAVATYAQAKLTNPVTRTGGTALTDGNIVIGGGSDTVKPSGVAIKTSANSGTLDTTSDTEVPTSKVIADYAQAKLTNPVTGSSLTTDKIVLGNNNNSTVKASTVGITTTKPSGTSDNTTVPTSNAVWEAISDGIAANDAMVYKTTIAGGSTGTYGALTPAANKGETYKVSTAGKIDGVNVKVGDLLICNTDNTAAATSSNYGTIKDNWDFIKTNTDGDVTGPNGSTDGHVAVFNGATGNVIKDSGYTIASDVPANAVFTDTTYTASDFDIKDLTDSTNLRSTWSGKQDALTNPVTRTGNTALTNNKIVLGGGNNTVKPSSVEIKSTALATTSDDEVPTSKAVATYVTGLGYTSNTGTITSIKMNGATKGTSGEVDLGTVITAHQDISGKQDKVTAMGSTTKPVYTSAAGTFAECNTYAGGTAVTLNGTSKASSTASFYAPTSLGTAGQVLKTNSGATAVEWGSVDVPNEVVIDSSQPSGSDVEIWIDTSASAPVITDILQGTVSVVSVTADMTNVAPAGSLDAGKQMHIIYRNDGSADYTIAITNTYKTPTGQALTLTCPVGGYCEANYYSDGTYVYVRGV